MAKCKYCGEEFIKKNKKQVFCSGRIDGISNCRDKYHCRASAEDYKKKDYYNPQLDELSLVSAGLFKGEV